MKKIVVKIGGSTFGSHDTTLEDLVALHKEGRIDEPWYNFGKRICQHIATKYNQHLY